VVEAVGCVITEMHFLNIKECYMLRLDAETPEYYRGGIILIN
jgi:hypothetical protein